MSRLCIDNRIGGRTRYYFGDGKPLMLIPDEVKKCVLFIGIGHPDDNIHFGATAFLVMVPNEYVNFCYLVTAKHSIQSIRNTIEKEPGKKMYLRANLASGSAAIVEMEPSRWSFHPDDTVDVAIMPFGQASQFDHAAISIETFLSEEVSRTEQIGIGDELFLVGLFQVFRKAKRNIPIVRVGNIAAMPEESIPTQLGDIEAYLIECRSLKGLSGSPAFVMVGPHRRDGSSTGRIGRHWLMGLTHGHFDEAGSVNMGIAVVVPAKKILEAISQPQFVASREAAIRKARDAEAATPD